MPQITPKILAFDVFGTVVDWHGSIAAEVRQLYPQVDGDALALAWREGYQPAMQRVRSGELGWTKIDDLHRLILDSILPRFGLGDLPENERRALNRVWHRLNPWPDVVEGLSLLKRRKNQFSLKCSPFLIGLSSVAHSAGVRMIATSTESVIAETMVTENCR